MIRRSSALAVASVLAASAAVLVASAAVAVAGPPVKFTKEYDAGIDAFRLGRFDDARAHLEKARTLAPKLPGPHRFLAAVAQAQSRWDDCIASARTALAVNPTSSAVGDTRKLHDECRAAAGRMPYRGPVLGDGAALGVTANIDGATIKVDGVTIGGTPLAPRPVIAGAHAVEVVKLGYATAKLTVDALPGIVTDLSATLAPTN